MARQLRPYLPGGFFHVTARTAGKALWFDDTMRDHICENLALVQQRLDTRVAAFVIMPNHLHLVLQQRDYPISRMMQQLLCRIAAAVKKKYGVEGHVFQRRYWDRPCNPIEYLHSCIEYVHRNPVDALLCTSPDLYRWSSYPAYSGARQQTPVVVEPISGIIAAESLVAATPSYLPGFRPFRDLGDVVDAVLREFDPPIDIELLRNMRGRSAAYVRRACIRRAALSGYRNYQIARYLKVSESVVSKVVVVTRQNAVLREAFQIEPKSEGE